METSTLEVLELELELEFELGWESVLKVVLGLE
jgi:hypothetical protein